MTEMWHTQGEHCTTHIEGWYQEPSEQQGRLQCDSVRTIESFTVCTAIAGRPGYRITFSCHELQRHTSQLVCLPGTPRQGSANISWPFLVCQNLPSGHSNSTNVDSFRSLEYPGTFGVTWNPLTKLAPFSNSSAWSAHYDGGDAHHVRDPCTRGLTVCH